MAPSPSALATLERISARREQVERMTSKQRVRLALEHQEPDRVPIDLWVSPEVKRKLEAAFDCDYDTLLDLLGVDLRVHRGPSYVGIELEKHPDGTVSDLWGVRRKLVSYGAGERSGTYKELAFSPLAHMTSVREIEAYGGWPSPDWWDYGTIAAECRQFDGKCVVFAGDRLDRTAQLKLAMYLRGVEQIMIDLVQNPAIVECILERAVDYYLEYNRRVFEAANGAIDVFMMGDDFGTQTGPFMSLSMWERYFERGFRSFIGLAHEYDIQVMHHTCGSVRSLIPKFVDAGLDILQSLQPRAKGMDLCELKREYGTVLAFHGSIDIQATMPFGSPQEVKKQVQARLEAGRPDGGFIICTAHNLQPDVPLDNILALLEAYHEFAPC